MRKILTISLLVGSAMFLGFSNAADEDGKAIDLTDLDQSVKAQEDFYDFSTGGWRMKHPLTDEYSRYGTFDVLAENNVEQVRGIIEAAAKEFGKSGSVKEKIGKFYASGMDTEWIESVGLSPLKSIFKDIESIKNITDVQEKIATLQPLGIFPLFYSYGSPDNKNSDMMIAHLTQGGLGMERDYYIEEDERSVSIREAYLGYMEKMFELAGEENTSALAETVMSIETRLAKASMTRLERRDPFKTYNKMSIQLLQEKVTGFDWSAFYENWGLPNPGDINVTQPDFFKEVGEMMQDVSVNDWKVFLRWKLMNTAARYLSSEFDNAQFDFYGSTLQGKKEQKPRWKRVVASTNNIMGEAVGELYVSEYFPPEAKNRMQALVETLRVALGIRIDQLEWMSDETKIAAREKLAAIRVKVGYPDKWKDYSTLQIKDQAYVLNVFEGNKHEFAEEIKKIGQPVDKDEWHMTPQTVNAYYNPSGNEIVFPAAILQPPFFYLDADNAVNYGAIGVVIGHEMTHGFDDKGRSFDKDGNMNDWWTEEDADNFKVRAQILVDQFNDIVVLGETHADGELCLGENIADLGGLNISYEAYSMTDEAKKNAKIDGFSAQQRFYLAYAKLWGQNIRDKEILRRTKEDVHSLGKWRVNVPLSNLPAFHKAFDIKEDDSMYLPADKRAVIW